jgi:fermentation-respiration switch protein FrsA (DUF1100 family)
MRFAGGLARSGVVVMVPESATLRDGDIVADEVDTLRIAVELLRSHPDVDARRVGLFGFSVGGALVLLAAEDEALREKVAFVHVSGGYFDTRELLSEVATHQLDLQGQLAPWIPQHVTKYTLYRQLISALPEGRDRDLLWRAMLDGEQLSSAELEELSSEGRLVLELGESPTRERVDEIVEALPISSRERLDAISPNHRINHLQARLYVLHGRSDDVIAFTQSRQLAARVPEPTLRCYTESGLFEHVSPDTQPGLVIFARELPGLAHHAWLVGSELL